MPMATFSGTLIQMDHDEKREGLRGLFLVLPNQGNGVVFKKSKFII
jgi:hypothetical protein